MSDIPAWRPTVPLEALPSTTPEPPPTPPAGPRPEPAPAPPKARAKDRLPRPPRRLPKKLWLLLCAVAVLLAVVFCLLPVSANFADDPLLRLRYLNPELSPPAPTAACGSAIKATDTAPRANTLFEIARAHACQKAAKRRVAGSLALGAIVVVLALLGMKGGLAQVGAAVRSGTSADKPASGSRKPVFSGLRQVDRRARDEGSG